MLGAQQLLDLLICLPAVTLDGQAGIGIVDIGGNDRDDLIFISPSDTHLFDKRSCPYMQQSA